MRCAIGFSAVGSLKEEVRPRDFVVVDQYVDWTKGVSLRFELLSGTIGNSGGCRLLGGRNEPCDN